MHRRASRPTTGSRRILHRSRRRQHVRDEIRVEKITREPLREHDLSVEEPVVPRPRQTTDSHATAPARCASASLTGPQSLEPWPPWSAHVPSSEQRCDADLFVKKPDPIPRIVPAPKPLNYLRHDAASGMLHDTHVTVQAGLPASQQAAGQVHRRCCRASGRTTGPRGSSRSTRHLMR